MTNEARRVQGSPPHNSPFNVTPARSHPSPRTVILARRWFLQSFWHGGSGWFPDLQAAENMFDTLIGQGAFTADWLERQAAQMDAADNPEGDS